MSLLCLPGKWSEVVRTPKDYLAEARPLCLPSYQLGVLRASCVGVLTTSPTRKPFFMTSACGVARGSLPRADSVFNGSSFVPWIPTLQGPDSGCPPAPPPLEIHCWFWDTLISSSQFHDQSLSVSESPCWRAGVSGSLPGKSEGRGLTISPCSFLPSGGVRQGRTLETLVQPQ